MTNNKQQTEINAVEYIDKVNQFAKENNTDKPRQQTAIEWLFDNVYMAHSELSEKLKQAKEMEVMGKEMSYSDGYKEGYNRAIENAKYQINKWIDKELKITQQ
mgnify:CR=1 FL=1|jgi:flagellar biosynthesis/type III secretory pathway protein FliH